MIVLLLRNNYLSSMVLPSKIQGQFWLKDEGNISKEEIVAIEGCNEQWVLKGNNNFKLCDGQERVVLQENIIYKLEDYHQEKIYIFVEGEEFHTYLKKYKVASQECVFSLGRKADNSIVVAHPSISRYHLNLSYSHGHWEVTDLQSMNGTFVNQKRIQQAKLKIGDIIYVMGVKIVIGIDFLAINMNSNIMMTSNDLIPVDAFHWAGTSLKNKPISFELFNRLPRRRLAIKENEICIESPPMSLNNNQIPLMLRMGGSMAMGGQSLLTGNILSVLSSLIFPMLNSKYSENQKKEYEEKRVKKYSSYLRKKEQEILEEKRKEEQVMKYNYPSINEVLEYINNKKRLWERRNIDDDFLNIRVGTGNIPLLAKYRYQEERFDLEEDELENEMYNLIFKKILLENVPIMNSFKDDYVSGISGNQLCSIMFVERLIAQIVMTHSYDEVKIMILADENDLNKDIMKKFYLPYLPHLWNNQKTIRFIATNASEAFQLGEFLKSEIEEDLKGNRKLDQILKERSYYMIFALNKKIFDSMGILKDIMQKESNIGVSIITAFNDLPKECSKIFQIHSQDNNQIVHIKELDKNDISFHLDNIDIHQLEDSMKKISNTYLKIVNEVYTLPKMFTFLEMFGVGRIEHLNSSQRWKENNPVNTLTTPIGIGTDGSLFELDLHQKYQGPHGLIAGMTGSGKSEFIITYILSLAINYHPDEVAFFLIDYKGGGLAGAFEDEIRGIRLPHLVGTMTNLDGSMIQRSLMSIQSELVRRQKVFNDVKKITGEASIDIYSYQSLYRRKIVNEPLPHLFIIADEFAELKQQQPEFMDQLISAARIGRSLGIHLILATQKPSGVVNDQIRSNTKFRVCLKVQDKSDSMDMLKRGEAAELKETGRFYLQVGYNEYFALGQSAWCGAMYEPQEEVIHEKDNRIQFIDHLGQTVIEAKEKIKRINSGKSQLSAIVSYLSDIAKKENIIPKKLCLDPLVNKIDINDFSLNKKENEIVVPLGMMDNPGKQFQLPYNYDFQNGHHLMIVGDSRSGKTTLIQSMLYILSKYYTSQEVNYYALDYSSRLLSIFKGLPHCGEILTEDDEQQIPSFFKLIQEIIEDRKKLFKKLSVDSYETANKRKKIPLIIVIIDNLSGLSSSKIGENYVYHLSDMLKTSINYGIKFIISINHLNEAPLRVRQEMTDCITFHMKDRYDYSEALGIRCQYEPPVIPGRGLIVYKDEALEWQAGMYKPYTDEEKRLNCLKKEIQDMSLQYQNTRKAKSFIKIPEDERYETFAESFDKGRIPLGYSLLDAKAVALPLRQFSKLAIYIGNLKGKEKIIENFLYTVQKEAMDVRIVKKKKDSIFKNSEIPLVLYQNAKMYSCEDQDLLDLFKQLAPELVKRKEMLEKYCQENDLNFNNPSTTRKTFDFMYEHTQPIFVMFESFLDICFNTNEQILKGLKGYLQIARKYNIYFLGCFYPNDARQLKMDSFFNEFMNEKLIMLFGGNYDKQDLIQELPVEFYKVNKDIQFNKCIMQYRGKIYSLQMPCGSLKEEIYHEDELSIF